MSICSTGNAPSNYNHWLLVWGTNVDFTRNSGYMKCLHQVLVQTGTDDGLTFLANPSLFYS